MQRKERAMKVRIAIITSSDSGAAGERQDVSGPLIREIAEELGGTVVAYTLLPDEKQMLSKRMAEIADRGEADLILTTGGTGFSSRDCMPEATMEVSERMANGIPEAMRAYSMQFTGRAMLSRAAAGIRKETLIVNLPGSPKAIKETLEFIYPHLIHGVEILTGKARDCARTDKKQRPYIVAICGVKNSGKTTVITKLIKKLTSLSYRVAVIKHDGHDFEADRSGTDSFRIKEAGAYAAAVYSNRRYFVQKEQNDTDEKELIQMFPESDIILIEGLKNTEYPKFEIVRNGISNSLAGNKKGMLGILTDIPDFSSEDIETIQLDDMDRILKIILDTMQ